MTLVHILLIVVIFGLWIIIPLIRGGSHGEIKTTTDFVCLNCGAKQ